MENRLPAWAPLCLRQTTGAMHGLGFQLHWGQSFAHLIRGACGWSLGDTAGAKFQGGPLVSLLPLGEEEGRLWALSLAGQKKLKEVAFLGPLGGWKASVRHLALVGNQGSQAPYSLRIF